MTPRLRIITVLATFGASACATVPPPKDLQDARLLYERESTGRTAELHPAALVDARRALDAANSAYERDPESVETRDTAYVALRKTQLAAARAELDEVQQRKAQLQQARIANTEAELQKTRSALQEVQSSAQLTQAELEAERQARADAEKRANDAVEALSRISAVKKDERGVVLTLSGSVLFASGKAELLPIARSKLDDVAAALVKAKAPGFVVEGHTDSMGADAANLELSLRRAQSVREYLISRGVPAEEIKAVGKGEAAPVADNTTAEGRANNRRVEIVILKNASLAAQ